MRTNLSSRFLAVQDVRTVLDPWGIGIEFGIERSDSPAYQDWLSERAKKNPVFAKLGVLSAKAALGAIAQQALGRRNRDLELEQLASEVLVGMALDILAVVQVHEHPRVLENPDEQRAQITGRVRAQSAPRMGVVRLAAAGDRRL